MVRYFCLFICLMYSLSTSAELKGDWIVSNVYIDVNSTATPKIAIDDPIYLYRIMQINEKEIKSNLHSLSEIESCSNYKIDKSVVNFNDILNDTMAKREGQTLTSESFGININPAVNQIEISCSNNEDKWTLFEKNKNEYLLIDNPFWILGIKKVTANEIQPSFLCENAKKISENRICQNVYLSGLDRSIHDLYHSIKNNLSDSSFRDIYEEQKKFIKQRDGCDNDKCLVDVMSNQVLFLNENKPVITL